MISRIDPRKEAVQEIYSVRFCNTELIARNSRDFARIAVFARWYTKTCSESGSFQCSLKRELTPPTVQPVLPVETEAIKGSWYLRLKKVICQKLSTFVNRQIQLMEKWV